MKKIIPLAFFCACVIVYFGLARTPENFPVKKTLKIDSRLTTREIGVSLKENNIIQSPLLFKLLTRNKSIKAGSYYFNDRQSIYTVIDRLVQGKSDLPTIRITIPEGSNNEQIGAIIWGKVADFNAPLFIQKARNYQGYLFPDTYNIPLTADEDFVISLLRNTFDKKVGKASGDVIKMAAIIEEEGSTEENRKMISDVLWRRLKIGMALQVDVARETYKWKGLTSKPITNPGLESINAALNPTPNPYLYYISDNDGIFHYAKTYAEHLVNIQKYLKK